MSERHYVTACSLSELRAGDLVVHPVIGGLKVARSWQWAYERAAKAEELRDAGDDLKALVDNQHPDALNPDQWLHDRATRIDQQEEA